MTRFIAILAALTCAASAQTYRTVTADTNNVIRTNFSLGRAQVSDLSGASFAISNITGLQTTLDGKLATNGSAAGLTNFPASILTTNTSASSFPAELLRTNGDASTLTNFPASILQTNSANGSFPAFLARTNADGAGFTNLAISNVVNLQSSLDGKLATNGSAAALTNFPTFNQSTTGTASNVTGIVQITNGGTGTNSAAGARVNLLPSYAGNSNKVLAVNAGETDVEWMVQSGGGGITATNVFVDLSTNTNTVTLSNGIITSWTVAP